MATSVKNAGDYLLQADIVECIYRLCTWKKIESAGIQEIFSSFENSKKVVDAFSRIRSGKTFLEV